MQLCGASLYICKVGCYAAARRSWCCGTVLGPALAAMLTADSLRGGARMMPGVVCHVKIGLYHLLGTTEMGECRVGRCSEFRVAFSRQFVMSLLCYLLYSL